MLSKGNWGQVYGCTVAYGMKTAHSSTKLVFRGAFQELMTLYTLLFTQENNTVVLAKKKQPMKTHHLCALSLRIDFYISKQGRRNRSFPKRFVDHICSFFKSECVPFL